MLRVVFESSISIYKFQVLLVTSQLHTEAEEIQEQTQELDQKKTFVRIVYKIRLIS